MEKKIDKRKQVLFFISPDAKVQRLYFIFIFFSLMVSSFFHWSNASLRLLLVPADSHHNNVHRFKVESNI